MKKDDRLQDKAMEKLVANKLRGQLQPQAAGCPDAETLAAYVEGTLAAGERPPWEDHFATCARCQEQVATLVRWSEEDEPLEREAAVATRRPACAPFRWAWAAPVLLAVFVAGLWYTGEFRSRLRQTQETSMGTPPSAPTPATPAAPQGPSVQGPAAVKGKVAAVRKDGPESPKPSLQPQRPSSGNAADLVETKAARKDLGLEGRRVQDLAKLAVPAPSAIPDVTARAESAPVEPGARVGPTPMAKPSERARMTAAGMMAERAADADLRTGAAGETGRGGGGASSLGTAALSQEAAQAGAAPPPAPGTAGAMKEKKAELSKRSIATNLAQDALLLSRAKGWRVSPHGLIQRIDARGNWITVPSGVDADLFDISFPAPNVGWAVGQTGLTIRTTDGGNTWRRIPTPTREDLIQVSATTELAARIETRNHQVWETTDGGETWRRSSHE